MYLKQSMFVAAGGLGCNGMSNQLGLIFYVGWIEINKLEDIFIWSLFSWSFVLMPCEYKYMLSNFLVVCYSSVMDTSNVFGHSRTLINSNLFGAQKRGINTKILIWTILFTQNILFGRIFNIFEHCLVYFETYLKIFI